MTDIENEKIEKLAIDIRKHFHADIPFIIHAEAMETVDVEKDEIDAIKAIARLSIRYSNIGVSRLSQGHFLGGIINDVVTMLADPRGVPPENNNPDEQNTKDKVSEDDDENRNEQSTGNVKCPRCGHIFTP